MKRKSITIGELLGINMSGPAYDFGAGLGNREEYDRQIVFESKCIRYNERRNNKTNFSNQNNQPKYR